MRLAGTAIAMIALVGSARAGTVTFTFEEFAGSADRRAAELCLLAAARSGVSMLLYRENRAGFSVLDSRALRDRPFPAGWGGKHLSPFGKPGAGAFVASFDVPVGSVRLEFGDFGGDKDLSIVVAAYDGPGGNGEIVDVRHEAWGAADLLDGDEPGALTVRSGGDAPLIRSVLFLSSGGSSSQSLYWDNITVTAETGGCPWDCSAPGDGVVDVMDLFELVAQWGGPGSCDTGADGRVWVDDLMLLLAQMGTCPK